MPWPRLADPILQPVFGEGRSLYMRALDTAGMPADPAFRTAVREHVEFGSRVAMRNAHARTDEELHPLREVPRWTWAGDDEV